MTPTLLDMALKAGFSDPIDGWMGEAYEERLEVFAKLIIEHEAEKQEPVAWMDGYRNIYSLEEKAAGCEDAVIPLVPAIQHWSDCAVHNEPAYPKGDCDCGGYTTPPAYDQGWKDGYKHGAWANTAAPVQEPSQTTGETNVELGFYSDVTGNGQQRELVGEVEMGQLVGNGPHKSAGNPDAEGAVAVIRGVDEHGPMLGWYKHWINFPVGTQFYTTPPAAQRQWVGLEPKDMTALVEQARQVPKEVPCPDYNERLLTLADAKLREKNAA